MKLMARVFQMPLLGLKSRNTKNCRMEIGYSRTKQSKVNQRTEYPLLVAAQK